jgi:hypothetical protein
VSDARVSSFCSWCAALVVALLALSPRVGWGATHKPNYTPTVTSAVVENPEFNGVPNTMMYTVTVTVDDTYDNMRHRGEIAFTSKGAGVGNPAAGCPATTDYTWSSASHVFSDADTWTFPLYNLQPGTSYYYMVRTGTSANYKYSCGALTTKAAPTPTVPSALADLNLSVDNSSHVYATKYVMFDTDGCGENENYLVAMDADTGNIVWYLNIPAVSGIADAKIGGWRFQEAGDGYLTSDRIVATLSSAEAREYLVELELDGTVLHWKDFGLNDAGADGHRCDGNSRSHGPCPHHDAFKSDLTGETYVLTAENSDVSTSRNPTWTHARCTDKNPYRFVGDGYQTLSEDYSTFVDTSLIEDLGYDPAGTLPGPDAPAGCATAAGLSQTLSPSFNWIDWIHTNAIAGTPDGAYLDLSLKEFDQVIRVAADGTSTSPVWRLSSYADYSDFTLDLGPDIVTGSAGFAGQHDVHSVDDDTIMMFDNEGDVDAISGVEKSRVLSIDLDEVAGTATIDKSWALVEDVSTRPGTLDCPTKGSAQLIPGDSTGDRVLALCHEHFSIEELSDPTGFPSAPLLYIAIPDPPAEVCGGTTESSRRGVTGWYRAYPLDSFGDF